MDIGGQLGIREELDGKVWTAPDVMASEVETGEFLYGLVRLLKPTISVETGCYRGDSSLYIAKAVYANGHGRFYTCDTDPEMVNITANRIRVQRGLDMRVCDGSGLSLATNELMGVPVDFAFLDSSGDRLEEAKAFTFASGAIVALHDARRPVYEQIKALGWSAVFIPTPRGIAIFQVG